MDLVEFLNARCAEEEAQANKQPDRDEIGWTGYEIEACTEAGYPCEQYLRIAKARVLREVEVKRRIIELHAGEHDCVEMHSGTHPADWPATAAYGAPGGHWSHPSVEHHEGPCPTLFALALPYTDHPDYRPEWKS